MNFKKIFNHQFLLGSCNFIFLTCGILLLVTGFYVFCDAPRVLLSRLLISTDKGPLTDLPQPLFYYVALGLIAAGIVGVSAALLGFWATCLNTYCILGLYFVLVIILLLLELSLCMMITIWPQCLGLRLNVTAMVKTLQGRYGISGEEQFTAAMDLAQTRFQCCAINTSIIYDTSLWKLTGLGRKELTVPLTCCQLRNWRDRQAYLDPVPVNTTLCQALLLQDHERFRHLNGCAEKIEEWYRDQYIVFLAAGIGVALIEFCVLLSIILSCTRLSKERAVRSPSQMRAGTKVVEELRGNIYTEEFPALPEIREVYIQPPDLHKNRHSTTFKPISNQYQISQSYLV